MEGFFHGQLRTPRPAPVPFDCEIEEVGRAADARVVAADQGFALPGQARLADLVPPPRKHRHRYHGVFAPNHKLRQAVTVWTACIAFAGQAWPRVWTERRGHHGRVLFRGIATRANSEGSAPFCRDIRVADGDPRTIAPHRRPQSRRAAAVGVSRQDHQAVAGAAPAEAREIGRARWRRSSRARSCREGAPDPSSGRR